MDVARPQLGGEAVAFAIEQQQGIVAVTSNKFPEAKRSSNSSTKTKRPSESPLNPGIDLQRAIEGELKGLISRLTRRHSTSSSYPIVSKPTSVDASATSYDIISSTLGK